MVKSNILLFIIGLYVMVACEKAPRQLPILGPKEVVEKDETGNVAEDTIYHTIPDFRFRDQDSNWVSLATFNDKIYVADFFFTTCPTICPVMKSNLLKVYEQYINNNDVAFLSHTIDPVHDSIPVLKEYADRLDINSSKWHLVNGSKDSVYAIAKSYLVSAQEDKDAPGGFIHSGALILIDKNRRIRGYYDGTEDQATAKLIEDIKLLHHEGK
ncbi:MAG: SCO family protein [Sporocytophaga sp.]|nr:SCO family protein [Sporocytophaga sp.]